MTENDRAACELRDKMFYLKSAYDAEMEFKKIAEANDRMRELWSEYAMLMGDKLVTTQPKVMTKDEYKEYRHRIVNGSDVSHEWSDPVYLCTLCGGTVRKNADYALLTYPPQFLYRCDRCGHREYGE